MKRKAGKSNLFETVAAVMLVAGAGLGAYLILIYDGSLSWGVRIGVPLALLALGAAGMAWTKLYRKREDRPLDPERLEDLVNEAAKRVVDGTDGRTALLEVARERGDDLYQAVNQFLTDGAGLLRTQPGRECVSAISELSPGDEAGVRAVLARSLPSESSKGGDGTLVLTAILAGVLTVAVASCIALA